MLKYFLADSYISFKVKNLRGYFNTYYITEGFLSSALISIFIYLNYFHLFDGLILKIINSIDAILGFYILLNSSRKSMFWSGFFVGILWFYWIGFSFRYYNATYAIPFMILFVSLGYGLIFWFVGIFHPIIRAIIFTFISYLHPLNFNWFIPELTLLDSFIGIHKWQFGLFLLSLTLLNQLKSYYKLIALLVILPSITIHAHKPSALSKQKIYLSKTEVPQNLKWEDSYKEISIKNNFKIIYKAIDKGYDIVVISESAFALFLNKEPQLMEKLKKLSKKITIITGALYTDGVNSYNSTYYFINQRVKIANKMILVPFGEEIPLPKFIDKIINKLLYNGAEDYKTAKNVTDIKINDEIFRNAICYEATRDELFSKNPKLMIAISNNAWFTPSIEPTLQKLLLRYFSYLHHTTIYHCANSSITTIIR